MSTNLKINLDRLTDRLAQLAKAGALAGGGVSRLALTDSDKDGRDLVVQWMQQSGLTIRIDQIGNVVGIRPGKFNIAPVMIGSHIDTVTVGGAYDGCLGVLAGLEIIDTLNDANIYTDAPLAVAFFTNEEGSRFAPDMMGSLCFIGDLSVEEALNTRGIYNSTVRDALKRIRYDGKAPCGSFDVQAFFELHIEQGPRLELENKTIGVVEAVQGISWTEITLNGDSIHAGTYPMSLRRDASYVQGCITRRVREIAEEIGIRQVATVGRIDYHPGLINVVPQKVTMTVDMRNPDNDELELAEKLLHEFINEACLKEGIDYTTKQLARFLPTEFDKNMVSLVEQKAQQLGHSTLRMYSPAGHDAQILQRICPTAMIFIPCENGISHNVKENVKPEHIEAGANVLLNVVMEAATAGETSNWKAEALIA